LFTQNQSTSSAKKQAKLNQALMGMRIDMDKMQEKEDEDSEGTELIK